MPDKFWAKIPLDLLQDRGLTSNDVRVYAALATWSGCPVVDPSVATVAQRAGLPVRSVQRALRELQRAGRLVVDEGRGRGSHSQYWLDPEQPVVE